MFRRTSGHHQVHSTKTERGRKDLKFTPSFSFCTVYLMMATGAPKHVVVVY
jgi:hypothetical protein